MLIFTGPPVFKEIKHHNVYGIIAECSPFSKGFLSEGEIKILRRETETPFCWGSFHGSPLNQILYYFEQKLIDGAIIASMKERDLRRLSESVKLPLFLQTKHTPTAAAEEERLPITGLCLPPTAAGELIRQRKKPYILRFSPELHQTTEIIPELKANPPFTLWCKDPLLAEMAGEWTRNIFNETR